MDDKLGFSTKAIHSDNIEPGWPGNPVVCGISFSTTFKQNYPGKALKYEYSRSGNPTREALEKTLAVLEKSKYSLTFSSGLAAISSILHILSPDDEIICIDDVYGGTNRLFNKVFNKNKIITKMIDLCNLSILEKSITSNTKIIWIETPTNPLLKIVDIKGIKKIISTHEQRIILIVDNTFLTPYFQNPIELGADIVVHSATKYINGHSDVIMGCIMLNDEELFNQLKFLQNAIGAIPSPFDCYMVLRGIKTLALRMEKHQENAMKIAKHFEKHPGLEKVIYPGLKSHPGYTISKAQSRGFSGMISFAIKGDLERTVKFLQSLKIFTLAESLGGHESLCEHPALMTHASVPPEQRAILGIGDNLVRMSIGIEDVNDLINDIEQALN